MSDEPEKTDDRKFVLYAVRKDRPGPLIQISLPWERLMEDVVFPFDEGEMFFIDGAAVKSTDLDRLKILMQSPGFNADFARLNWNMRTAPAKDKEIYARQYSVLFEAILRNQCEDVTSQVIKAYKTAIKPSLKDYLPKKQFLLESAVKIFIEGMKLLPIKQ
jgi:hypothetical protein